MRTFTIERDPNGMDVNLYLRKKVTIQDGLTILVGCNGYGKTTFIRMIEHYLKQDNIPVMKFDNLTDGGSHARSHAIASNNIEFAATAMCSSEGENIVMNMSQQAYKIGQFVKKNKDAEQIWFLFDAIDSGLSIDNVIIMKDQLFRAMLDNDAQNKIHILVSANGYEFCNGTSCLDVYTGKYKQFKTYNAYRKFILMTSDRVAKRYENK